MHHIYRLKYPNYDVNNNKIALKILHILLGLKRHADSNKVVLSCFVCFSQLMFVLFD